MSGKQRAAFGLLAFLVMLIAPPLAWAQTIKVGLLLPLSGPTAWAGKPARIAAEMAIDEVNAGGDAGAFRLQLVVADGACDARTTSMAARKLVSEDNVQALIGEFCSSASIAAAQVANEAGIPMIVQISTADGIARKSGPYVFQSIMQNHDIQSREEQILTRKFRFRTAAILIENNDFGLSFRANMRRALATAGVTIVVDTAQDYTDTDWYSSLTSIQGASPDIILMSVSAGQAANLIRQYAEAGMTIPLFSDYPPPPYIFEQQVGVQAGKVGLLRGTFFIDSDQATAKQKIFVAKFRPLAEKQLGVEHRVVHWDIVTYDAVRLLAGAIRQAKGAKGDDLAKSIGASQYDGVLGKYAFDANREIKPEGFGFLFIRDTPEGGLENVQ